MNSMSSKVEPTIRSRDAGQRIPCFENCQLTIIWMSNIKYVRCKPRLHASFDQKYDRHVARRRRRRRWAHAPAIHAASYVDHKKKSSALIVVPIVLLAALRAAGALPIIY